LGHDGKAQHNRNYYLFVVNFVAVRLKNISSLLFEGGCFLLRVHLLFVARRPTNTLASHVKSGDFLAIQYVFRLSSCFDLA
jgi:hypothetical protein